MASFAPADAQTVTVLSPHGCGQPHTRPVGDDGQPVAQWIETCPACHKHLTGILGWGSTADEIPETHDQKLQREAREKRGAADMERATGTALEQIAQIPGAFEKLAEILAGQREVVRCSSGHANPVAAKFCGECGAGMGELITAVVPDAPPAGTAAPQPAAGKKKPLKDMKADDLRAMAKDKGLDADGTRVELIERIRAAR